MKRVLGLTLMATFLVWSAAAQTSAGAQTSGSTAVNAQAGQTQASGSAAASNNTSATAGKSGAQANSSTAASGAASASHSSHDRSAKESKGKESSDKSGPASAAGSLASGSTLNAVLSRPLDSKKAKPGDQVMATTTQDTKSNGQVVIPKHSHLVGHVTQASAKGKGDANSSLGVVFDKAVLKNGQEVPVHAVIQALAASQASLVAAQTAPEMAPMEPMGAAPMASSSGRAGAGLVGSATGAATSTVGGVGGGVGQTVDATAGAAGNVAGNAVGATAGAAGSAAGSVAGSGVGAVTDASGHLLASSSGVAGLPGVALQSAGSSATQGSLVTSGGKSVHLDSGTQMLLRVVSQ